MVRVKGRLLAKTLYQLCLPQISKTYATMSSKSFTFILLLQVAFKQQKNINCLVLVFLITPVIVICTCEMELSEAIEAKTGVWVSVASFCVFFTYSMILENLVTMPKIIIEKKSSAQFINIAIAWTHASTNAGWNLYSFYTDPDVISDVINHSTTSTYLLCCYSVGYFVHDAVHCMRHEKFSKCWEIVLHHIVAIVCVGSAFLTHQYVNFAAVAFLSEVNSVFLHIRLLLKMLGYPKDSGVYKINRIVNMLSFIIFRLCVLFWMCRWLILRFHVNEEPYRTIWNVGLFISAITNIILFGRLLMSDNWVERDAFSLSKYVGHKKRE